MKLSIDANLLKNLVTAIDARPVITQLLGDLKDHCLQFEANCLNDLKAQLPAVVEAVTEMAVDEVTGNNAIGAIAGEVAKAAVVQEPVSTGNLITDTVINNVAMPAIDGFVNKVEQAVENFLGK